MNDLDFIHRYLPPKNQSKRVLLLLHGTGGDESDLLPIGRELDPDAGLLSPRGKVLENGSARFFRRVAEGVFDEADVVRRAAQLSHFIAAAAKQYEFELRELIAVGYSNGANIASAIMLLHPETIPAAILLRAMVVLSNPPPPNLSGKRVFISAGASDPIIPAENAQRLASTLRNAGAEVTLKIQQASHGLVPQDLADAKAWLTS